MADQTEILPVSYRFNFKPLDDVEGGGCHVDLYVPYCAKQNAVPLFLFIHGGGWIMGTSASIPYNQVRYLLDRGVAVASVEYRLLPHVKLAQIREDLLDAYKYIHTKLNDDLYDAGATWTVDRQRICGWGASAGGSNVLFLVADLAKYNETVGVEQEEQEPLPSFKAVIVTYPMAEFDDAAGTRADFERQCETNSDLGAALESILSEKCSPGYRPNGRRGPLRLGDASSIPARLVYIQATLPSGLVQAQLCDADPPFSVSPIKLITSHVPPTFIVVAKADKLIPPSQSYNLFLKLQSLGVECQMAEAEGMDHGAAECQPFQPPWPKDVTWWDDVIVPSLEFALGKIL